MEEGQENRRHKNCAKILKSVIDTSWLLGLSLPKNQMNACNKCLENNWNFKHIDTCVIATCRSCEYETIFDSEESRRKNNYKKAVIKNKTKWDAIKAYHDKNKKLLERAIELQNKERERRLVS